jgi:hypothetical protein
MAAFEFSDDIASVDITKFLAASEDTPIVVWTIQSEGAVQELERTGKLTGDPAYAFANNTPGKRLAYDWLRQMMAKRLTGYSDEWPIWTLVSRPTSSIETLGGILLRAEIPKSKMLVSFYKGWLKILGVMEHLPENKNCWPEQWLFHRDDPLLYAVSEENADSYPGLPVPISYSFNETQCRRSWEQIFDLALFDREGFAWRASPPCLTLQALVPTINLSQVTAKLSAPNTDCA